MNFKNNIATTREQSERLLALGVKPETADMHYFSVPTLKHDIMKVAESRFLETGFRDDGSTPAWSLSRLLEMMPTEIENDYCSAVLQITHPVIQYWCYNEEENYVLFNRVSIFDNAIECIGWLIRNGHFNKEYLIEKDNEL